MSDCSGWLQAGRHCGTISVTLDWPDTGTIPACFRPHLADEAKVQLHRLGTRTVDFHVCAVRGVIPS